jgi:hypothetical protein
MTLEEAYAVLNQIEKEILDRYEAQAKYEALRAAVSKLLTDVEAPIPEDVESFDPIWDMAVNADKKALARRLREILGEKT